MKKILLLLILLSGFVHAQRSWLPLGDYEWSPNDLTHNSVEYRVPTESVDGIQDQFSPEYARFTGVRRAVSGNNGNGDIQLFLSFYEGVNTGTHRVTFRHRAIWSSGPSAWSRVRATFPYPPSEGYGRTDVSYSLGNHIHAPGARTIEVQPILYRRGSGGNGNSGSTYEFAGRILRFRVN